MKINLQRIRNVVALGIGAIFFLQLYWIYNMSQAVQSMWIEHINQALEYAISTEGSMRMSFSSEPFSIHYYPEEQNNAKIVTRTIVTEDTTVLINCNRNDPTINFKMRQFAFKNSKPLVTKTVDSLLVENLSERGYAAGATSVEYIDLKQDSIIDSFGSRPSGFRVYSTDIVPLDILDSVGVRAHVQIPFLGLLWKMLFQLALSLILLIASSLCLVYLQRIIGRQRKKEEQEKLFVNTMTHEFKRPISAATMMLHMIPKHLEQNNPQKIKRYVDKSLFELNKLALYTQQIQEISKGEAKLITLSKQAISLTEFWEDVKERYDSRSDKEQLEIHMHWQTSRQEMLVDPIHFSNVVDNLMENAFKYSENKLRIDINLSDRGSDLEIRIKDNGWGMSLFDSLHIFNKFYRSTSRGVQQKTGFGLGLTYVKAIVEAHSGRISVDSKPGKGSEFTVLIPV